MVGKDIRKLSQQKKQRSRKGGNPHKGRAKYKACDPFSGRSYPTDEGKEYNDDPDASELEDFMDNEEEDLTSYSNYKSKPSYRRDCELSLLPVDA